MKPWLCVVLLLACKAKEPPAPAKIIDAAPPADANLTSCRTSAIAIAKLPPAQRAQALINACKPCGDWTPLLSWSTPADVGGPRRSEISGAMEACNAYCSNDARQRFLNNLDAARGQDGRGPWRYLGEVCKEAVSALPDTRFMGAPYFALDRIARAIGDPAVLGAIKIPLPPLTLTGVGVALPSTPAVPAEVGDAALTVLATQLELGTLPIASLAPDGVHVAGDYPGASVELGELAGKLKALGTVAVVAPRELPAARLAEVVAAAGGHRLELTVGAHGPGGWTMPGSLPIALIGKPDPKAAKLALGGSPELAIKAAKDIPRDKLNAAPVTIAIDKDATVGNLATLLGAIGYFEVKSVALVRKP